MKKRLICALLAVMMLLSLLPGTVMRASAAEMTSSEDAIAILKQLEGFAEKPYYDNGQYSIGYGSGCNKNDYPNGITEAEADALLREYLADMEKSLNYFINRYGLSLKQNQFDALMLLTYNVGANWVNADGEFRSAVINGLKGNDFIYAMTLWSNASSKLNMHLVKRRLAEANLYLNGTYSLNPPENYSYVLYDNNGGVGTVKVQGYDAAQAVIPKAAPVRTGYRFMGWYTAAEGGSWVTELNASTKKMSLYAHWQQGAGNAVNGTPVSYSKSTRQISSLNVYEVPGSSKVVDKLTGSGSVNIVADYVDASNIKWGKLSTGGWVNLGNAVLGIYTAHNTEDPVTVTVTADNVNVRSGAGTHNGKVGKANKGDSLEILETCMVGSNKWGRFSGGWISLMYTTYDSVLKDQIEDASTVMATGTVVNCTSLRIRSGAGTNYPILGSLSVGTQVQITQQKAVNGVAWGKISSGWICLTYVSTKVVEPDQDADKEETTDKEEPAGNAICTVTVTSGSVNVRSGAGTNNAKVGSTYYNQKLDITEVTKVGNDYWGKFSSGWICLTYTNYKDVAKDTDSGEETKPEETKPDTDTTTVTGTVNSTAALRIRKGPGTQYDRIGCYTNGNRITILETQTVSGQKWGKTDKGWICLDYVKLDSKLPESGTTPESKPEDTTPETQPDQGGSTPPETEGTPVEMKGVVSCKGTLNIRSGAGTGYPKVGNYVYGDKVEVVEQKNVNGQPWGRTDKGWICLSYIRVESGTIQETFTGTVNANGLRIRNSAGTGGTVVAYYSKGNQVEILETTMADGMKWGRTVHGWISLEYVDKK